MDARAVVQVRVEARAVVYVRIEVRAVIEVRIAASQQYPRIED